MYNPQKPQDLFEKLISSLTFQLAGSSNKIDGRNVKNATRYSTTFANAPSTASERLPLLNQAAPNSHASKFQVDFNPRNNILIIQCKENALFQQLIRCLSPHIRIRQEANNTISLHYPLLQKINLESVLTSNLNELKKCIQDEVDRASISIEVRESDLTDNQTHCFNCCTIT